MKTELPSNNSRSLTKNNFAKPGKRKKQKKKYGNLFFVKKSVLNLFIESKHTHMHLRTSMYACSGKKSITQQMNNIHR